MGELQKRGRVLAGLGPAVGHGREEGSTSGAHPLSSIPSASTQSGSALSPPAGDGGVCVCRLCSDLGVRLHVGDHLSKSMMWRWACGPAGLIGDLGPRKACLGHEGAQSARVSLSGNWILLVPKNLLPLGAFLWSPKGDWVTAECQQGSRAA